ncbi:MAG TPA: sulfate ABC transporter substrate-binding protein [Steroidobacteraceae bacterium]|nr:sulfate ABC transporter substrate-binding protein [Steroidobacteraceae bacterium]
MTLWRSPAVALLAAAALAGLGGCGPRQASVGANPASGAGRSAAAAARVTLLNVSYDATRELYQAIDPAFAAQWLAQTGQQVRVLQSHGGSEQQTQAIINGLQADVATLGSSYDVQQLYQRAQLIPADWAVRLPDHSAPYTSTIVFLVREGNPKNIRDWADLIRPGVQVITPNPKTSGAARWAYLAAWAWAERQPGGSEASAEAYVKQLYQHVPVLDSGGRGATDTFVERGIGDVMLSWENEALLAERQLGRGKFEIVLPSLSILAEPSVTLVDKVADRRGTRTIAQAYLQFLYSKQGQQIIAQNFYRPRDPDIARQYAAQFPPLKTVTVEDAFGGWAHAQAVHFNDGGTFDQIYGR